MNEMPTQGSFEDISPEYAAFVENFKPKKTTDDCYTPENIYDAVLEWAAKKYGFDKANAIRPFWPGGDYQREKYPDGCVVVDNPPFSIMSKICRWYNERGVRYFLFSPALSMFASNSGNYICCGASVTYENGAVVNTSFVTNMGEYRIETAPDLRDIIKTENDRNAQTTHFPKYSYPDEVITSAGMNYLSVHHAHLKIRDEDLLFVRSLDAQDGTGKEIYGGGFILTERATAERKEAVRVAAENAAKEKDDVLVFSLSPREKEMQRMLGEKAKAKEKKA